jgi:uncharacterized protein YutE (UPF0331/DUF86 family)
VTPEQVAQKLVLLAEALEKLRALPRSSLADFTADDRTLDAALRRLQVAIQILIDVGSHVVSRLGLGAPDSSLDVLARLERAGKLPAGAATRFGRIFAFRNRIVHLYDRVDAAAVFAIVQDDLGDLEELARLYAEALRGA